MLHKFMLLHFSRAAPCKTKAARLAASQIVCLFNEYAKKSPPSPPRAGRRRRTRRSRAGRRDKASVPQNHQQTALPPRSPFPAGPVDQEIVPLRNPFLYRARPAMRKARSKAQPSETLTPTGDRVVDVTLAAYQGIAPPAFEQFPDHVRDGGSPFAEAKYPERIQCILWASNLNFYENNIRPGILGCPGLNSASAWRLAAMPMPHKCGLL